VLKFSESLIKEVNEKRKLANEDPVKIEPIPISEANNKSAADPLNSLAKSGELVFEDLTVPLIVIPKVKSRKRKIDKENDEDTDQTTVVTNVKSRRRKIDKENEENTDQTIAVTNVKSRKRKINNVNV